MVRRAGHALLTDAVIAVDALNPQIAARLCTALGAWRRYDPARQELMQAELNRILGVSGLSPNTYEVAAKAIA